MNNELLNGLVIGISSGVITALGIYIFQIVWKGKLVPWYEKRIYKGINIQGSWRLLENQDTEWTQEETMLLEQTAHSLSGTSALIPRDNDGTPKTLSVKGEISDRFITLVMRSPDQTRLSYCTVLGQITGDGNYIEGQVVFYNTVTSGIANAPVKYKRM